MADCTDLQTLCDAVLAAADYALDTIPAVAPGLEGAPERQFISDGQPALAVTCDQLTVNSSTIREGPTDPLGLGAGTRHKQNFWINHVGMQVWVVRCRPQDIPQVPATMTAFAAQTNADAWALWNVMHALCLADSPDPLVTLCDEIFFDALTPLQPSGTAAGWLLSLRIELHGYEEALFT